MRLRAGAGLAAPVSFAFALALAALPAHAAQGEGWIDDIAANSRYELGAAVHNSPDYVGSSIRSTSLVPVLAFEYRWLRVSASGASAILGFGQDPRGPGASAAFIDRSDLKLGAGLRLDSGRKSSASPDLAGFDDIRRTLRGRLYASYALTDRWSVASNVSQDLLGRQGGALASADLGYRLPLGAGTQMTFGGGANWGNAQRMQTYFGVSDSASVRSGLPAYRPGAGLIDLHAGTGITTAFTPRWIGFASLGAAQLRGPAAQSPLTRNTTSASVAIGLAYRCCTP